MLYLFTILIMVGLISFETSLLPYFQVNGVVPFVVLSFLAALAVRYQGTFHLVLAFLTGVYFDSISSVFPGTFTIIFTCTMLLGRLVFFRETGYNAFQSFLILLSTSSIILYIIFGVNLLLSNSMVWIDYIVTTVIAIALTTIFGYFIYKTFDRYIDWMNKKTEERFR